MTDDRARSRQTRPFLVGLTLYRRPWTQSPALPWPDHCEFCDAEFGPQGISDGWSTQDRFFWICEACFEVAQRAAG